MSRASAIPPSSAAQTAPEAARVSGERRSLPNGMWGMALFLAAEATVFGGLIASYWYLDFGSAAWPPPGVKHPSVVLPSVATGVLVLSGIPIWLAAAAARHGQRGRTIALIAVALVVQGCYLAFQIVLFHHDLQSFTPQHSAYGSIYYAMLAVHHGHVAVGLGIDLVVLGALATVGLTNYWLTGVRALALYWYVVIALAVAVLLTQISPSL